MDDSQDTSDNIGNINALREKREGFAELVEVGFISGLDMQMRVLNDNGTPDDSGDDFLENQNGRIEYEGFETVDLRLGSGSDLLTVGGDFNLDPESADGGEAAPELKVVTAFPKGRLAEDLEDSSNGIKGIIDTISGVTLISGGDGGDEFRVLRTNDLEQADAGDGSARGVLEINTTDGEKFSSSEIVELTFNADFGYFVFEFDSGPDDTVPGAEQSVPIFFDIPAAAANASVKSDFEDAVKEALEDMRLVGTTFVDSVSLSGNVLTITFDNALGDLPTLRAFETQLLISGDGGEDVFNLQASDQPTYLLGGDDADTINLNVAIDENGAVTVEPPEPLFTPIPAKSSVNGVRDLLTADGESQGDQYLVYLFGADVNSQINLFDSGAPASGTDSAKILGTDDDNLFLLRAAVADAGLAFVAMLKPPVVGEVMDVERVNYTGAVDSIQVFGLGGDDRFGIDDVKVDLTIYGGPGEEFFQIGQLYKSPRTPAAGVPNADVFATIETTRGFLSNGISSPVSIFGGDENDEFVVYHNLAPLALFGDDGDDVFLIRAFALLGSQEDLRERTDVSGDAGADFIQYAVNAPVNIDGGDGFDTVIIIGTEFGDDFVVTENGVFGAGLNILFTRVEAVDLDGAEGDDRFFIRGTGAGLITNVTGGLGSDTFFVNGPTPDVISNDLLGHSGLISHLVDAEDDSEYAGLKTVGISANVADDDEPAIRVIPTGGSNVVSQALGIADSYAVVLTRKPENGAEVVVKAFAPRGVRFKSANGVAFPVSESEGATLVFDDTNWDEPQIIEFEAAQLGSITVATATEGDNLIEPRNEVQLLSIGAS
ncbi:MAG: hypothetical protein P8Y95_05750, partial [Gammaproteobacteria bacterium]